VEEEEEEERRRGGEEERRRGGEEKSKRRQTHLLQYVQRLEEECAPHPVNKRLPPTQEHHQPQQGHPVVARGHEGEEDAVPVEGGERDADVDDDGDEEPGQDGDDEEEDVLPRPLRLEVKELREGGEGGGGGGEGRVRRRAGQHTHIFAQSTRGAGGPLTLRLTTKTMTV
jgi:hypothetical protein